MSISSIGSLTSPAQWFTQAAASQNTPNNAPPAPASTHGKVRSDFATLFSAVQSGDASAAQQALTAVQSDIQSAQATYSPQGSTSSTQLPPDLQALFTAVQKGDVSGAQQALTQLQSDAQQAPASGGQGAQGVRGHHGHHHHHQTPSADTTTNNDGTTPSSTTSPLATPSA